MKIVNIIALIIVIISFGIGIYFYPQMPANVASHWDVNGYVNGYMSKFWGLFLMPVLSFVMFMLLIFIPKMEPLKENLRKFRKYFDIFSLIIILFFFYVYLLTIFWGLGSRFNMSMMMLPAIGILFYVCGVLMENTKRNWFIGIRTPWTLSSDIVWEKTHKIGGLFFKISGILAIIGIFFSNYSLWLVLVPILFSSAFTIIYSYIAYKKEVSVKGK
jgi:uncharacterized membrane protein